MITRDHTLRLSDRCFSMLLLWYPARFRTRFGPEMRQLFQDCSRIETARGGFPALLGLALDTIRDLVPSLAREWRREFVRIDGQIDYIGLGDCFMITVVAGTNLLVWGWMGAILVLNLVGSDVFAYWSSFSTFVTVTLVTLAMAALVGVASATIVRRSGRTENNRIRV